MIISIIIVSGFIGGSADYLKQKHKDTVTGREKRKIYLYRILLGIIASCMVPLFLHLITSDLLTRATTEFNSLLIFMGFCLIASVSSNTFIQSMTKTTIKQLDDKIKDMNEALEKTNLEIETSNGKIQEAVKQSKDVEEKAKELQTMIEPIIVKNKDTISLQQMIANIQLDTSELSQINSEGKQLLTALDADSSAYISVDKIRDLMQIPESDFAKTIEHLQKDGLITELKQKEGSWYGLTTKGNITRQQIK